MGLHTAKVQFLHRRTVILNAMGAYHAVAPSFLTLDQVPLCDIDDTVLSVVDQADIPSGMLMICYEKTGYWSRLL